MADVVAPGKSVPKAGGGRSQGEDPISQTPDETNGAAVDVEATRPGGTTVLPFRARLKRVTSTTVSLATH
jgi:hypothetical protein